MSNRLHTVRGRRLNVLAVIACVGGLSTLAGCSVPGLASGNSGVGGTGAWSHDLNSAYVDNSGSTASTRRGQQHRAEFAGGRVAASDSFAAAAFPDSVAVNQSDAGTRQITIVPTP